MKRVIILLFIYSISARTFAQNINGIIESDSANLTVVKVWGTHYERGFAYGYLMGAQISDMVEGYIKPVFGPYLDDARQIIIDGEDLQIDSVYINEAIGVVDGMDSAGTNFGGIDYIDGLVFNSFLDVLKLLGFKADSLGCSSLMSWGDATMGTGLNGKSVISRHLDWTPNQTLINNQLMVIHIPAETDEQPFALVGFAGQMSVLSGFNQNVAVFQHMMSDFAGTANHGLHYEPVWLTMRKSIEKTDFNNDGVNNTQDVRDAIEINSNGFADGYIVTALAPSSSGADSLVALVAEVAPQSPLLTFRSNSYPDDIPSDNLYAANFEIKRNNSNHYCNRYYSVMNALGNGLNISEDKNWQIMRDNSNGQTGNLQFMQFIPELSKFKISVYRDGLPAYLNDPLVFNLNELFSFSTGKGKLYRISGIEIFPNPVNDVLNIKVKKKYIGQPYYLFSSEGLIKAKGSILQKNFTIKTNQFDSGIYFIKIGNHAVCKFVKL